MNDPAPHRPEPSPITAPSGSSMQLAVVVAAIVGLGLALLFRMLGDRDEKPADVLDVTDDAAPPPAPPAAPEVIEPKGEEPPAPPADETPAPGAQPASEGIKPMPEPAVQP